MAVSVWVCVYGCTNSLPYPMEMSLVCGCECVGAWVHKSSGISRGGELGVYMNAIEGVDGWVCWGTWEEGEDMLVWDRWVCI